MLGGNWTLRKDHDCNHVCRWSFSWGLSQFETRTELILRHSGQLVTCKCNARTTKQAAVAGLWLSSKRMRSRSSVLWRQSLLEFQYQIADCGYCILMASRRQMKEKFYIKNVHNMSDDMQRCAAECASRAIKKKPTERKLESAIQEEFNKMYCPPWYCRASRKLGDVPTVSARRFIYFCVGEFAIILYTSG